jgi:hypothetical protein
MGRAGGVKPVRPEGRGAMGAPGVSPGEPGRDGAGRAGSGAPGIDWAAGGPPGATTCVGGCGLGCGRWGTTGVAAGSAGKARAERSGAVIGARARSGRGCLGPVEDGIEMPGLGAAGSGRAGILTVRCPGLEGASGA